MVDALLAGVISAIAAAVATVLATAVAAFFIPRIWLCIKRCFNKIWSCLKGCFFRIFPRPGQNEGQENAGQKKGQTESPVNTIQPGNQPGEPEVQKESQANAGKPGGQTESQANAAQSSSERHTIFARQIKIKHSEKKECWAWVKCPSDPRFTEVAELLGVKLLSIRANNELDGLLAKTEYAAYLIFNTKEDSKCLDGKMKATVFKHPGPPPYQKNVFLELPENLVQFANFPFKRLDGWTELKLGQFNRSEAIGTTQVVISIEDPNTDNKKTGLIIAGIEIRPI